MLYYLYKHGRWGQCGQRRHNKRVNLYQPAHNEQALYYSPSLLQRSPRAERLPNKTDSLIACPAHLPRGSAMCCPIPVLPVLWRRHSGLWRLPSTLFARAFSPCLSSLCLLVFWRAGRHSPGLSSVELSVSCSAIDEEKALITPAFFSAALRHSATRMKKVITT